MSTQKRRSKKRPNILVLEALSGSGDCVRTEGGNVIDAPPSNVARSCDKIDSYDWDGLVLTGGGDVDPRLYGQRPRKEVYGVSENRDLVEVYALEVARKRGLPVLGICRGAQIINVEAGGTLKQHVHGHRGVEHAVLSRNNTIMREFAGLEPVVVSLHHQRLEEIADGYDVTGRAADGTVESIEDDNRRVLGVQFHPEVDWLESYAQAVFRWVVCEAALRAGLPEPSRVRRPKNLMERGYGPSKFHSVSRAGKHRGSRSRGSSYTVPRLVDSTVIQSWICPHCAIRFDEPDDRDDHVRVLHDGMVTPLTDETLKRLKRGSRRDSTTLPVTVKQLGPGELLSSMHADVREVVDDAVSAGWTPEPFGTGTRFVRFVDPTDPNNYFITMLTPLPQSTDWRGALARSMERAGAPTKEVPFTPVLSPRGSTTP